MTDSELVEKVAREVLKAKIKINNNVIFISVVKGEDYREWNPITNMNAAMVVLWKFDRWIIGHEDENYIVAFFDKENNPLSDVTHNSLPHAVLLAAIKAVEGGA
jgi:fibrillarin-like rRNA methylase